MAGKKIKELEQALAQERAELRMKRREHIEILDERTPGGILGGPGYDRESELAALELQESSDRTAIMEARLDALRARRTAWWAVILGVVNLLATAAKIVVDLVTKR